jgi:biopolymer transport protein ExbB
VNRILTSIFLAVALFLPGVTVAQDAQPSTPPATATFDGSAAELRKRLEDSLAELAKLREDMAAERIPMSKRLGELESELTALRQKLQQITKARDERTLDRNKVQIAIKQQQDEMAFLVNLLGDYLRNFETSLHIAEVQRFREVLNAAKLAMDNSSLTDAETFEVQSKVLTASLERLHEALGGVRFEGTAVDATGMLKPGAFVQLGPVALFRSTDGQSVGVVEQRIGSLEPTVAAFGQPEVQASAQELVANGTGQFPFDPTLGNALKIEQTQETLIEHIKKGGPIMVPIFVLAGAALLVVLYKWLSMLFIRNPSQKRMRELLSAVAARDTAAAQRITKTMPGPVGAMLRQGADHLDEPRELIEEVMYESVLSSKLKIQSMLPFVAISASAAPLLGLLGTVTGIMNTFSLITVFGTGDVRTLSSGISEALITTEYGLIVAIPSLLLHAFLSRKAKGIVDRMEKSAVAFLNEVSRAAPARDAEEMAEFVKG